MEVINNDDLMIITNKGIMIRQSIEKLNIIGRNTQGVKLIKLEDNSQIASVTKVIKEEDLEKHTEEEPTNTKETPSEPKNEDGSSIKDDLAK